MLSVLCNREAKRKRSWRCASSGCISLALSIWRAERRANSLRRLNAADRSPMSFPANRVFMVSRQTEAVPSGSLPLTLASRRRVRNRPSFHSLQEIAGIDAHVSFCFLWGIRGHALSQGPIGSRWVFPSGKGTLHRVSDSDWLLPIPFLGDRPHLLDCLFQQAGFHILAFRRTHSLP